MFLKKRRHAQLMGLIKESAGGHSDSVGYSSPWTPPSSGSEEEFEYEQEQTSEFGGSKFRKMSESSTDSGIPPSEVCF